MSQTILIEPNDDLKKIFSLNLHTFVGTDVIHRRDSDDTINLLAILPQIALIITRVRVGNDATAKRISKYLQEHNLEIPMIVMGETGEVDKTTLVLPDPINWEILIAHAAKFLGVTLNDVAKKVKPDYMPIGVYYFYDIINTPCDIYIRLKKGPGEYQYVKRIHSKDTFDKEVIKKYEEQGLKEFYIPRDYQQYFINFLTNQLVKKLERDDLALEDRILTTANTHEIVRDQVRDLGLEESLVDLADAGIESMIRSVKNSPEVTNLLKFLFTNKVSYAYQHCHLMTVMCHYILSKQSWYKSDHLETLSFVSFFSDVTLKSMSQMQICNMSDLNETPLTDEERANVLSHAKDAVALIENHPEVTDTMKHVLLQHHGAVDGIGFPENPDEEIHPLAKVFIIADNFVKTLLHPEKPKSKKEILPILYKRFTHSSYQKIIKALEQRFEA
ncbi:MAG: HD domain-containing phosphohydrolase [Bacteriovoracaceae bacterium]